MYKDTKNVILKMRNENFYRDTIRPFSFENVVEDFKWLEGPTGSEIIDNFNNEYTYEYIFDLWVKEKNPSKILGLPILADQYEKALSEYGKYGKLIHFPEKEIYKMVKI